MTFGPIKDGTLGAAPPKTTRIHVDYTKIHPNTKFKNNPSRNAAFGADTRM